MEPPRLLVEIIGVGLLVSRFLGCWFFLLLTVIPHSFRLLFPSCWGFGCSSAGAGWLLQVLIAGAVW